MWMLHGVLERRWRVVGATCGRCENAAYILYLEAALVLHYKNYTYSGNVVSHMNYNECK